MESSNQNEHGWNDGLCSRVRAESAADPITAVHEAVHERISATTPDGMAHRCLFLILKRGATLSNSQREILARSYSGIVKETRFAHEVGATYLSLKQQLRPTEQLNWNFFESMGGGKYQKYYQFLYDVIDQNCNNVDLQLIIGNCIVTLAFSSRFIIRLPTLDLSSPIVLAQDEQPKWRIRKLVDAIGFSTFGDLLSALNERHLKNCQEIDCVPWDITSEQDWLDNVYSQQTYLFNLALEEAADAWLLQKTQLPIASAEEASQASHALVAFASSFGVPEGVMEYREGSGESNWSNVFYDRAHGHAEALIENPSRRILPQIQDAAFYDPRLFSEVIQFTLLLAPPEKSCPLEWSVLLWTEMEGGGEGRAGHEAIMHWLTQCGEAASLGIPRPRANMIIVAESLASDSTYYHTVSNLLQAVELLRAFSGETETLFWYVDSNYIEFLERSISTTQARKEQTPVAFAAVHFYRGAEQPTVPSHGLGGITVAIAKLPTAPGLFIRAFTEYAGWAVRTAAEGLLKKGDLTYLSEDEVQKQMDVVRDVIKTIDQYWANY